MPNTANNNHFRERNTIDLRPYSRQSEKNRQTPNKSNSFYDGTTATEDQFSDGLSALAQATEVPVSLYLHVPFSPYQLLTDDTLNVANNGGQEVNDYIDALEREIQQLTQRLGQGRHISQLHLGGSAPNSISQKHLVRIQDILERYFEIDADTETSLVADPGRSCFAQMDLLTGLGFRQINYGVCDIDADIQTTLGRLQSPELIKESFQASREAGFEVVTSDLLYGIPNQSVSSIKRTIDKYLEIQPDRILCRCYRDYGNSGSSRYTAKQLPSLADKMAAFHAVVEGLTAEGYEWIGLDCFAKSGDALTNKESPLRRNRIGYSAKATPELIGLGSNAISEIQGVSIQKHAGIDQWSKAISNGGFAMARGIKLTEPAMRHRQAMEELMCTGQTEDLTDLINESSAEQRIRRYEQDGLIQISDSSVTVTPGGQFGLSQLWEELLPCSLPH